MSTFVLIHGAGDAGWYWHLVEAELRARGHGVVAPDLPGDDESLELNDYADAVVAAVGDRRDLIVVAQSFGGFTAPLVAVRLPVDALVFVAGMVPSPGEAPRDWWERTGYRQTVQEQVAHDGGMTGNEDPYAAHDRGQPPHERHQRRADRHLPEVVPDLRCAERGGRSPRPAPATRPPARRTQSGRQASRPSPPPEGAARPLSGSAGGAGRHAPS
jgi:hypothetical protein